tara:strand:- start:492 stop:632 length:141 start_codon:yes stop_codon:yes gene_type:complete
VLRAQGLSGVVRVISRDVKFFLQLKEFLSQCVDRLVGAAALLSPMN